MTYYKTDYHLHTNFSIDSTNNMEQLVLKCIDEKIDEIAITDHFDILYPDNHSYFNKIDLKTYVNDVKFFQSKYEKEIKIKIGLEIGITPKSGKITEEIVKEYGFDFIIGSVHSIYKNELWLSNNFVGKTKTESYSEYLDYYCESIAENPIISVCGHLDYLSRYAPYDDKTFLYDEYSEKFDRILELLVEMNKGLEINTSGYKYGEERCYPQLEVLQRFKQLNGKIITLGSDAHEEKYIAHNLDIARKLAISAGFTEKAIFTNLVPSFIGLVTAN